jgi:hypothetical protein
VLLCFLARYLEFVDWDVDTRTDTFESFGEALDLIAACDPMIVMSGEISSKLHLLWCGFSRALAASFAIIWVHAIQSGHDFITEVLRTLFDKFEYGALEVLATKSVSGQP